MDAQTQTAVYQRLQNDYNFKPVGDWLRGGKCPQCSQKELYTHADHPWVIKCGRLNKCGYEAAIKDLYPDEFNSWSERFEPTVDNPHAAAKAYLEQARGLNVAAISHLFTQENYVDRELGQASATVRFSLPNGGYWERIIDVPERFKNKAHISYGAKYYGHAWVPPFLAEHSKWADVKAVYITEGIFCALSLRQAGKMAVAAISCNNFISHFFDKLKAEDFTGEIVYALDSDNAGRNYTAKWVKKTRDLGFKCRAIFKHESEGKTDWNDALLANALKDKNFERYDYYGALFLAESPQKKAILMFNHKEKSQFYFAHESRMYWFNLDIDALTKVQEQLRDSKSYSSDEERREQALKEAGTVREIANCEFKGLYFQQNLITDESWYYFRVSFPHHGSDIKNTFTASQLASAGEFKKRLLAIGGGAIFTGNNAMLESITKDQLFNPKTVSTIDFIGYSMLHKTYIYNNIAISKGKAYKLNEEDYFDIGKISVKTLLRSTKISLNDKKSDFTTSWFPLLWQAYGSRGVIALAFFYGSLFAEQIRSKHSSFPFLELVGEAGTGKSTLLHFLWKLLGRENYEGFDPSKATVSGRMRNMAQVSNMPVVLIEGDRSADISKRGAFDYDELKSLYDGGTLRARGEKSGGNETYEPPFRGTICIAQNAPVEGSEAILSRMLQVIFERKNNTPETKRAADQLARIDIQQLSYFLVASALKEEDFLQAFDTNFLMHEQKIMDKPEIQMPRIAKNHAMLKACVMALKLVIDIPSHVIDQTLEFINFMAVQRQLLINEEPALVREFWDLYDYLSGPDDILNHAPAKDRSNTIALNFNQFIEVAGHARQQIPPLGEVKRALLLGKRRPLIDKNFALRSGLDGVMYGKSIRCWIFKRENNHA
jgi:hypothetical protein